MWDSPGLSFKAVVTGVAPDDQIEAWPSAKCSFLCLTGIQIPRMVLCYQIGPCYPITKSCQSPGVSHKLTTPYLFICAYLEICSIQDTRILTMVGRKCRQQLTTRGRQTEAEWKINDDKIRWKAINADKEHQQNSMYSQKRGSSILIAERFKKKSQLTSFVI